MNKLSYLYTAEFGIPQFSDKTQHGSKIVDFDVIANMNPVLTQQIFKKRNLHGLLLNHVKNRFIQVARANSIITRIMKPVTTTQHVRQIRLTHARHAQ